MPLTLWIVDEAAGKGWREASLEDKHVPMLRSYLAELTHRVGHRAKAVYVVEVYDQNLYDKTRPEREAPVEEDHVFPSAVEAAHHLGLKAGVVKDAIIRKRKQPMGETGSDGRVYPKGTAKLGGLALCWEEDADV